ncbi:pantoate--beta-alanine ligase [Pectinatus brassicae]|uniref:Pantothenate synthetase n=1 Tax=Pectinatus brassicae TaxID=862415 RepID=A0A840UHZ0_9FIRM|nr:pantoate--beta-alanine ligase [Pectinatus brassicae]MBB5336736.1 pantoate--beta-alanine ligase [Pectinatus brassicae]
MILCRTIPELQKLTTEAHATGQSIGLVPTMGALHEGHASLIKACHQENTISIVSIFVNPTQFGPNEDYDKYPRSFAKDCQTAEKAGADIIFTPAADELYPSKDMTWVEVTGDITKVLCGRTRPIHFRGVTTIITKLFNLIQPDKAYFGQKDAQQVEVLRKMVSDLFIPVELRIMPIIRESDGLAKSSRNAYLTPAEKTATLILYKSLQKAKAIFTAGERNPDNILKTVQQIIESEPLSSIDYIEIHGLPALTPLTDIIDKTALLAVAVKFGNTRLIDNIILEV